MAAKTPPDDPLAHLPGLAEFKRETSRRRQRIWIIALGVILVLVAVVYAVYQLMPLDAPVSANAGAEYADLAQGYTDQGFPRLGSPDAPFVVEEFSSYACPHCRDFHETIFPTLLDRIAAGQVQYVVISVPQIGWGAESAAKAAYCAGEQGRYWAMHDVLFDWQKRFAVRTFDERRLRDGAKNLGLDTAAFNRCLSDDHPRAAIDAARAEFDARHVTGTPTFFINGQRVLDYREFDTLGQE